MSDRNSICFTVRQGIVNLYRGFTLLELLIALIVILVLGSIATMAYRKLLDDARETVCVTNVRALTTAVEAYALENEVIPAVLGDLEPRHLEKAFAKVMAESNWYTRFSHRILEASMPAEAYANFLTYENLKMYGASVKIFTCPGDENGGVSYGINARIKGMKWDDISDDAIIVADCDAPSFLDVSQLEKRHGMGTRAVAASKGTEATKNPSASDIEGPSGSAGSSNDPASSAGTGDPGDPGDNGDDDN